ncbi:hypothetical protein KSP39_PZI023716 [Platanthera zijinensis]|uniref:Uncharacterized protein n=1 Tax=Platanthera zijinensis TaxID=2320716 RepID=A0AAP0ATK3_9ASPA
MRACHRSSSTPKGSRQVGIHGVTIWSPLVSPKSLKRCLYLSPPLWYLGSKDQVATTKRIKSGVVQVQRTDTLCEDDHSRGRSSRPLGRSGADRDAQWDEPGRHVHGEKCFRCCSLEET